MGYGPFGKPTTVSIERYQRLENDFNELLIEHKNLNESQKPQLNISDVIASKICKYCGKTIPHNDKMAKYGDGTYGCSKCEKSIDSLDKTPKGWKSDNSYWL